MVDTTPKDIGRNEPCPCGSGKKYKKCCFKTHRLQKETEKATRSVEDLVTEETTPWQFFNTLRQIGENNLLNLAYDFVHPQSPLRERFSSTEAFIRGVADDEIHMFARPGFEMQRLRHDGTDLLLLLARGRKDPKYSYVSFELLRLRDNTIDKDGNPREADAGFRVWDVSYHETSKEELQGDLPRFEQIGVAWSWE